MVVNGVANEDDPVLEVPRVYVIGPLSPLGLFHNYGHQWHEALSCPLFLC